MDGPRSQFTRALEEIELVRSRAKFDRYTELSKFHPLAPSRVRCYFHGTDYLTAYGAYTITPRLSTKTSSFDLSQAYCGVKLKKAQNWQTGRITRSGRLHKI
jgi:hypothetical protein